MSQICISINATRFGGIEDLVDYQGNPLIAPVGHFYIPNPMMVNNLNEQGPLFQYQNVMGGYMGNNASPMYMNKDGAFIFDPANPNVAHGTLDQLSEVVRKNYPENAIIRFISGGGTSRMSVAHQGYSEIRDLAFTESIGLQVRFKKANGTWFVHNRTDNAWYRPTVDTTGRDFAPLFTQAVVADVVGNQIQITFDDHGQMIGAEFLEDDDGTLDGFAVTDSNKIFELVYPGEQMVFTDE